MRTQAPQPLQASSFTMRLVPRTLYSTTQGDWQMTTESMSVWEAASLRAARTSFTSRASAWMTSSTPHALRTLGRSSSREGLPCSVTPLTGLPWPPVMAVVRLSRITTLPQPALYTAEMTPDRPEWANVESPMTEKTGRAPPATCSQPRSFSRARATSKPWPMDTEAPMSMADSSVASGGKAPSV